MERKMVLVYEKHNPYHETPPNKLLQGLQSLSDGRVFGQQKIGPCFKINNTFQLTLFNPLLTFNRMQAAQQ